MRESDGEGPRRRISSQMLDRPLMDAFPAEGVQLELPVARFADVFRTITLDSNTFGGAMMAVYLFYWTPLGSLTAMPDVPEDDCYRERVREIFSRGGNPTWGDLIGKDATYDPHWNQHAIQASEGFCHGATCFNRFREVGHNTLRLECNS